jgi:hypothetical protein
MCPLAPPILPRTDTHASNCLQARSWKRCKSPSTIIICVEDLQRRRLQIDPGRLIQVRLLFPPPALPLENVCHRIHMLIQVLTGAQGKEYPQRFFARDFAGNRLEFTA